MNLRVINTISIAISSPSLPLGKWELAKAFIEGIKRAVSSHGLSYTSFNISNLRLSQPIVSGDQFDLKVKATLTNTGNVSGSQVVQLYIGLPKTSELTHPHWQLRAFEKMRDVKPGESREVELVLDRLSVSYWDKEWVVEDGVYDVRVAFTSDEGLGEGQELLGQFKIGKGFGWRGL